MSSSKIQSSYDKVLETMFKHFKERLSDNRIFFLRYLNKSRILPLAVPILKKTLAYSLFTLTVKSNAEWDYKPELKKLSSLFLHKTEKSKNTGKEAPFYGTYISGDKQHIYDHDIWANIHYGYAGRMSGFLDIELIEGAEANDWANNHEFSYIKSTENKDTNAVILGIRLYEKYGTNLTKQDLENEIFNNRHLLNRHLRSQLIEKRHVVQKGDTVIGLAAENNIRPEEIMRKYPFIHPSKPLPVGAVIEMPSPDEIKMMTEEDRQEKMMCDAYLKQKSGAEHDAAVQEVKEAYECAEKYKALVQKTEDALKKESPETPTKTAFYIWKTANDTKVRTSHWERDGRVFSWANPPEGGHPGEDFNCRCHAVAYPSL